MFTMSSKPMKAKNARTPPDATSAQGTCGGVTQSETGAALAPAQMTSASPAISTTVKTAASVRLSSTPTIATSASIPPTTRIIARGA